MQLGGFYIWTISYQMVKSSALKSIALEAAEAFVSKVEANNSLDATAQTQLLKEKEEEGAITTVATKDVEDPKQHAVGSTTQSLTLSRLGLTNDCCCRMYHKKGRDCCGLRWWPFFIRS